MQKYLAAIIFLSVIACITIFLGLLFLLLKKGCCSCCGKKKDPAEEEEEDDIEAGSENDSEADMPMYYGSQDHTIDMEGDDLNQADPPPVITVSEFKDDPVKKKKNPMKSMLKKMKKPLNKVRFGSVSESEMKPLVHVQTIPADENHLTLHRSDSMESFVSTSSGMSSMTANLEEFGTDEVSPGRLQLSLEYDSRNWTVNIGIKQAECLIHNKNATIYWQVHLTFLPFKKHRFKTKYKASSTPVFNQTFEVDNIPKQALNQISIRLRVYGREGRAGRKKLAGEVEVQLNKLVTAEEKLLEWFVLKRKNIISSKA